MPAMSRVLSTPPLRVLHHDDGDELRLIRLSERRDAIGALPVDQAVLTPSLAGLVVRFTLEKERRT